MRCQVYQVGGMGILERLNRTFKYDSVFRDEIETLVELRAHLPEFEGGITKSGSIAVSPINRRCRLYYRRLRPSLNRWKNLLEHYSFPVSNIVFDLLLRINYLNNIR